MGVSINVLRHKRIVDIIKEPFAKKVFRRKVEFKKRNLSKKKYKRGKLA